MPLFRVHKSLHIVSDVRLLFASWTIDVRNVNGRTFFVITKLVPIAMVEVMASTRPMYLFPDISLHRPNSWRVECKVECDAIDAVSDILVF